MSRERPLPQIERGGCSHWSIMLCIFERSHLCKRIRVSRGGPSTLRLRAQLNMSSLLEQFGDGVGLLARFLLNDSGKWLSGKIKTRHALDSGEVQMMQDMRWLGLTARELQRRKVGIIELALAWVYFQTQALIEDGRRIILVVLDIF